MVRWLLVVSVVSTGCSFISATTPPGHAHQCMPEGRGDGPWVDAATTIGLGTVSALLLRDTSMPGPHDASPLELPVGIVAATLAVPYLASAIYGFAIGGC